METLSEIIKKALDCINGADWFYALSVIIATYFTLKYFFKTTPLWLKKVVTLIYGIVLGVIWTYTAETKLHVLIALFLASLLTYDYVIKVILKWLDVKYDDGKGLV
jgi:hypothetical protein